MEDFGLTVKPVFKILLASFAVSNVAQAAVDNVALILSDLSLNTFSSLWFPNQTLEVTVRFQQYL